MNFIDKIKAAFNGGGLTKKSLNVNVFGTSTDVSGSSFTGYNYIAIQKVATAVAQLPIYVVDEDGTVVEDSWMAQLIKYPNKAVKMSRYMLFEQVVMWLMSKGNSYIYTKPESRSNIPLKLDLLPSTLVTPNVSGGKISSYKVQGLGTIEAQHICHIKLLKPGTDYNNSVLFGQPRVFDAISGALQSDKYITDYINAYFARQAFPPLILESDTNIDDETWQQIKARFNEAVPGDKLLVLLEGGLKANPLNLGAKEIDFIIKNSLSEEIIKRIAAGNQVPYSLLMSEYQNKDTSKNTIAEFHQHTIEPIIQNIEEQLTLHLQELTKTTERITHDKFEWIDPVEKLNRDRFYYEIGVLDADYFASVEGFKSAKTKKIEAVTKVKSELLELKRDIYWREKDAANSRFAATMQKKLKAVIKEMEKQVLATIDSQKALKGYAVPESLFSLDKLMEMTLSLLGGDWRKFMINRARASEGDIGVDPSPLSDYDALVKELTEETTGLIKESYAGMGVEIKEAIQKVVAENPYAVDGDLRKLIRERVTGITGRLSTSRTATIARTTATSMNGSAQERVYKKFGRKYIWLSERDSKVRDDHRRADGTSPDANGYFLVGGERMRSPGRGGSAKNCVNCRCILASGMSVISDDDV